MAATYAGRSPQPVSALGRGASAIDDLIKFRLVESLLLHPDSTSSAAELAAQLGFHSVAVTSVELDELVTARVVRARRVDGEVRYGLVADCHARAALAELIAQGPPSLLSRLAAGSVSRIKKLLRKTA